MDNKIFDFQTPDQWVPGKAHFEAINDVPFVHDEVTSIDYYLAVNNKTLFCLFQASSQMKDWEDDLTFFPKKFDIYPGSKLLVHRGIAKQYLSMRNKFLDLAFTNDIKNVFIAGFSLGGGLAQLACEDAAWHLPTNYNIRSISYEGPRVFYKSIITESLLRDVQVLIKTFWDPVVHLPFRCMGLHDYGKVEWIGKWNRVTPLQHYPDQIEKNLFEKYGR